MWRKYFGIVQGEVKGKGLSEEHGYTRVGKEKAKLKLAFFKCQKELKEEKPERLLYFLGKKFFFIFI